MPAFVADRREANAILSRCADGRHSSRRRIQLGLDRGFGFPRAFTAQVLGRAYFHLVVTDQQINHRSRLAGDDNGIEARAFQLQGEMTGGERVTDKTGEWRFGDDAKLGRRGEAGADQRGAGKNQRVGGRKRFNSRRRVVVKQARAEAEAAEE